MKRLLGAAASLLLLAFAAFPGVAAESDAGKVGLNGTAGVGPIFFPKYTGGKQFRALPVPIISANYSETVYVELLRAGVYLLSSEDKKMGLGLAVEPRLGFHSSDGAKLAGMATRRHSLEGGLAFDWENDIVDLSVSYFSDLTHASGGTSLRASLYKDLVKDGDWSLGALLGLDRISAKTTNYYFGVQTSEATADRPEYRPGDATNIVYGVDGTYKLDARHTLVFGFNTTRLNGSAAASPIVETRQAALYWMGYAWNL